LGVGKVDLVSGAVIRNILNRPPSYGVGIGAASPSIIPSHVEEVKREGSHVFVATWTVTLKSNGSLVGPKLLKIDHLSTAWNAGPNTNTEGP
jgi:hypothetical protein